jgi:hypothetical protein
MFRRLWERWKILAHKVGTFQSRVLLNVFYFLILLPFGVGVKLLSDPLHIKRQQGSHWVNKAAGTTNWEHARRQF